VIKQIDELLPKLNAMCEALGNVQIDATFVEHSILREQSSVARTILKIHCKERAIEDLILTLRDKDMPVSEMLKV